MELVRSKLIVKARSFPQHNKSVRKAEQLMPYRPVIAICAIKQLGVKRFRIRSATQEAINAVKCEDINLLRQN
jgi:hypothetical protein